MTTVFLDYNAVIIGIDLLYQRLPSRKKKGGKGRERQGSKMVQRLRFFILHFNAIKNY